MATLPHQHRWGTAHRKRRQRWAEHVAAGTVRCARCQDLILPGEPWDLGHVDGDPTRYSGPEHQACNRATAGRRWDPPPPPEPERAGLDPGDERWRVPWLKGLRRVPADATWPRLMTVPHPRAVGSLGPDFIRWAEGRSGPLWWWQRLVATRLLEVDAAGELVWEALVMSTARQVGKSWLLRELCLWRLHQGKRFGEQQLIWHTGKEVRICREVQLPARSWAKRQPGYKVREVNGNESIEFLADGSRWLIGAKEGAYGFSVSCAAVDEAWKVQPYTVEEAVEPTMVEKQQPQLWLISTAHRLATPLMLNRRAGALAQLEVGDGDLLIEWSAPREAELDDVDGWRRASPHWSPKRERMIHRRLEAARVGEVDEDSEEPDPVESFRSQWLNQWPPKRTLPPGKLEDLLPIGLWASLAEPGVVSSGPVWVAVEDDYGVGAAVAVAGLTEDGRFELDGWACTDWDAAIEDVERLAQLRVIRQLTVGASLLARVPRGMSPAPTPAGGTQTRIGLALFRDLAGGGLLVHDVTDELDRALAQAQVKEGAAGLQLVPQGPMHLVKAAVWAVNAAHKPSPVPAIR